MLMIMVAVRMIFVEQPGARQKRVRDIGLRRNHGDRHHWTPAAPSRPRCSAR
jgi:hypothetical protein